MAEDHTGYKHNASDKKLEHAADAASEAVQAAKAAHPGDGGHDPEETRKHDDVGKDRLFEGREQHDIAEKASEKSRLAKDIDHHHHAADGDVTGSGTGVPATPG